jgi:hypothetical protein
MPRLAPGARLRGDPVTIPTRRMLATTLAAAVAGLAGGCGGSGKPAFCDHVNTLNKSIQSLSLSGGIDAVKGQLTKIESQAETVVSSAQSDFPGETQAIKTAFTKLQKDVKALGSSPSGAEVATVVADGANALRAVSDFVDASKSKCK